MSSDEMESDDEDEMEIADGGMEELESILSECKEHNEENQQTVIRLCQENPELVFYSVVLDENTASSFEWMQGHWKSRYVRQFGRMISPLPYLILTRAKTADIRSFAEANRENIGSKQYYASNSRLLHFACENAPLIQPGIISVLAKVLPYQTGTSLSLLNIVLKTLFDEDNKELVRNDTGRLEDLATLFDATFPNGFTNPSGLNVPLLLDVLLQHEPGSSVINAIVEKISRVDLGFYPRSMPDYQQFGMFHAIALAMLHETQTLEKVKLFFDAYSADDGAMSLLMKSLKSCQQTRELRIFTGPYWARFDVASLKALHDSLMCMSSLETLYLTGFPCAHDVQNFDLTKPILQMIERNKAKEIHISMYRDFIQKDPLFEALRTNKSLRILSLDFSNDVYKGDRRKGLLSILEGPNTTLESVNIGQPRGSANKEYDSIIAYYTKLNKYGRGKVRDQETTIAERVNLLQKVNCYTGIRYIYGLLRENPGNWCFKVLSSGSALIPAVIPQITTSHKRTHSQI